MPLSVPSINYVVFVGGYLILTAGSHVFALLMLFLCVVLHNIWSDKSMHLTLLYIVIVSHQYDVCKKIVCRVYADGYSSLSESGIVSSRLSCSW